MRSDGFDHDAVVIGSGFGGTIAALTLGREFKNRNRGETVHILERGTWWTTPVGTVADPEVKTFDFLEANQQPVQHWSAVNHFRGFIDLFTRCFKHKGNEDGLFEFTQFGKRTFLGLLGRTDGVTVVRASGVGGGSLVYSNITIRPPDFVSDDPRWPTWPTRASDYDTARKIIGNGVLNTLDLIAGVSSPVKPANQGLHNINTRTARLNPAWSVGANGANQIFVVAPQGAFDPEHQLWIDRARVFQSHVAQMTADFGAVDLAIADQAPEVGSPPPAQQ